MRVCVQMGMKHGRPGVCFSSEPEKSCEKNTRGRWFREVVLAMGHGDRARKTERELERGCAVFDELTLQAYGSVWSSVSNVSVHVPCPWVGRGHVYVCA